MKGPAVWDNWLKNYPQSVLLKTLFLANFKVHGIKIGNLRVCLHNNVLLNRFAVHPEGTLPMPNRFYYKHI